MIAIIKNNKVVFGPRTWHSKIIENFFKQQNMENIVLPLYEINQPVTFGDFTIMPYQEPGEPEGFNPKIHQYSGPFFTITQDQVIGRYEIADLPIEIVKNNLKGQLASLRWNKEVSGIKVTLQGTEVNVSTNRGERDIWLQALQLGADGRVWKFDNNIWLTLSLSDLQTIVTSIMTHVQDAFNWESQIAQQIDSCTTLQQLDAIVL